MAFVPTIIALASTAAGTATQIVAGQQAAKASRQEQAARLRQVQLESERKRREVIRRAATDRARALVASTASGAQFSSGAQGAIAQAQGQEGFDLYSQARSDRNTSDIFRARDDLASAQSLEAFGGSLTKLGSAVFNNTESLNRLYNQWTTNPWETTVQTAQGISLPSRDPLRI